MFRDVQLLKIPVFRGGHVATAVAVAITASGCAIVEGVRSDGTYERSIALGGPLVISPAPTGESSVVRMTGLGFGVTNNTAALGWFDETVTSLRPDCHVVLIENTDQQLKRFAALLPKNEAICNDSKLYGGQK